MIHGEAETHRILLDGQRALLVILPTSPGLRAEAWSCPGTTRLAHTRLRHR